MKIAAALLLGPLLFSAGCAARAPAGPVLLAPGWEGPPGQRCALNEEPKTLPAPTRFVDTAGLAVELRQAGVHGGYATVQVRYDSLGAADTTRLIESNLPDAAQHAALQLLAKRVHSTSPLPRNEQKKEENAWSALVRLEMVEEATLRVGRSEWCSPKSVASRSMLQALEREWSYILRDSPMMSAQTVIVRLRVDTTGTVISATPQKLSRYPAVDAAAQRVAMQMRFVPAQLNRRRVPFWATLPVTFALPKPERKSSRGASRPR